ncbi:uncharacterized protein bcl2l12 [Pristis pectinata]|uniref:uncharacterized protein bcl2l12 n=1 Tax=Pristis pectinata TaxID=685728 RepID=UPI00223E0001|nr:uncharacterized protein bcl2l12 [Pristis pectinata]
METRLTHPSSQAPATGREVCGEFQAPAETPLRTHRALGMAESKRNPEERYSLTVLKNETKLVMEAFLRRAQNEGNSVGHVGRYYHDARKFKAKTPDGQDSISIKLHKHRKSSHKGSFEREDEKRRSLIHCQGPEEDAGWDTTDEEICQAEEKKHGFKTAIKKLIKRQRKKVSDASDKKSIDFIEDNGLVKEGTKPESKANSLKRRKSTKPLVDNVNAMASMEGVSRVENAIEESSKHKKSGHRKFLEFFRKGPKKSDNAHPEKDQMSPVTSPRPTTLALNLPPTEHETSEFYSEVAKKLEKLAQECCAQTGSNQPSPSIEAHPPEKVNNNDPQTNNENAIERIVLILQDQGDKINEKMKDNPILQRPMSYHCFTQLVEAFTANVEGQIKDPATSPELTKIALTMELTRRVAGISSHPVQQLMGYTMQYMDMFVPWLQEQGGWEKVLPLDDVSEHQID